MIQLCYASRCYQPLYRAVVTINERLNEGSLAPAERLFKLGFITIRIPGKRKARKKRKKGYYSGRSRVIDYRPDLYYANEILPGISLFAGHPSRIPIPTIAFTSDKVDG